jgi:hypothetical protein
VRAFGVVGALTLALAACSSGSDSASPPGTSAGTSTTSVTTTPTTTSSTTGSSSTAAPTSGAPPTSATPTTAIKDECTADQLTVTLSSSGIAAGTQYYAIVFTNRSAQRCVMQGFPGASFVDANGAQIGRAAGRQTGSDPITSVALDPGAAAHATLLFSQTGYQGSPECGPVRDATSLRVYVPDSTTAIDLPWAAQVCTGDVAELSIQQVSPGAEIPGAP